MTEPDDVPELDPDTLYEDCPDCEGSADGCATCWDTGVVPHECHCDCDEQELAIDIAHDHLRQGSAWVGCIALDGGGVAVLASGATMKEVRKNPANAPYLRPDCPKRDRAAFALAGVLQLEQSLL